MAVLVGWVFAGVVWAGIDVVRGCELPHEDRLDCVSADILALGIEAPIPFLSFLVLWPWCRFAPRTALWQVPIWAASGFCVGYAASYLFFYAIALIYQLRPAPPPLFSSGTIAGTVGFTVAFALRYRDDRHLTSR